MTGALVALVLPLPRGTRTACLPQNACNLPAVVLLVAEFHEQLSSLLLEDFLVALGENVVPIPCYALAALSPAQCVVLTASLPARQRLEAGRRDAPVYDLLARVGAEELKESLHLLGRP